ncbi:MAG: hypothetical protein QY310_13750 [Candidatus Jettenia sp. CY-1]|nr:MAG: hypothetical protein QY310_13750 [Candidatus Jettenia sp. CY-1]
MKKQVIICAGISFLTLFSYGCGIASKGWQKDTDRKIAELSKTNQMLEKRIDDVSKSILLLVSDGNRLHSEVDNIKVHGKDIQQNVKEIELLVKIMHDNICNLKANYQTIEENFNKQIHDIQKVEIELANRLEMIKLDIKEEVKKKTELPANP